MHPPSVLILIAPTFSSMFGVSYFAHFFPLTPLQVCVTQFSQLGRAQQPTIPIATPAPAQLRNGFCVKFPLFWLYFQACKKLTCMQSWQHIEFNTPAFLTAHLEYTECTERYSLNVFIIEDDKSQKLGQAYHGKD